jgi:hydrogenobyrinic acid a,c-diamide synthase (glutamine-hydrolysing) (EC 6.3.5.9)/cobyrinate a,c-diamide synthase (EC 6.3.5.-)
MNIPRIVIAGTHSGVGKTTIATGIMAALKLRGRPIQGYKIGPDYIDPSYHTAATGKPSRNLDRWLLGKHLRSIFNQSTIGHWAVIEGVMGMFDGMSGTNGFGSTADISKELKAPVILIIDAASMARSAAALVYGFNNFDPDVKLAGVIINRVKSPMQEKMIKEALQEINFPVIGSIPREMNLQLNERHLGLIPVGEKSLEGEFMQNLADLIINHVDLEQLEKIMEKAPEQEAPSLENSLSLKSQETKLNIGIAWDEAFLFYYQDALDLAKVYGFNLIPFSPLHDPDLPPELDGLWLGGGFPELHLDKLSQNQGIMEAIRKFARSGKPIYAECGGYMYLGETIKDFNSNKYPVAGLIPMDSEMTSRLQSMGYRQGVFQTNNFLGPKGTTVHGHEFHYSQVSFKTNPPYAYQLFKGDSADRLEGFACDNIVASYLHLHFGGHPELLEHWAACKIKG